MPASMRSSEPGVVEHQLRLDLGGVGRAWLRAVVGDRRHEVRVVDGELVGHAAAPAKADGADFAGRVRASAKIRGSGDEIADGRAGVELGDELRSSVLVCRGPTRGRQEIRRERRKTLDGDSPCHVHDVRVEPAVLVDDDDRRKLRGRARRPGQIRFHRSALAIVGDRGWHHARIVVGNDRGRRLAGRN